MLISRFSIFSRNERNSIYRTDQIFTEGRDYPEKPQEFGARGTRFIGTIGIWRGVRSGGSGWWGGACSGVWGDEEGSGELSLW